MYAFLDTHTAGIQTTAINWCSNEYEGNENWQQRIIPNFTPDNNCELVKTGHVALILQ